MIKSSQLYHRQYYDRHALDWTRRKPDPFMLEQLFRRFLKLTRPGDTILDIGCANGLQATMFAGIGHDRKYLGIDISRQLLKIARRRWPTMDFRYGNILERQSLPQKKFRAYWASSVLMHIPEEQWPDLLTNINAITGPRAIGCFTVPTSIPTNRAPDDRRQFTVLPPKKLRTLLSRAGWRIKATGLLSAKATNRRWVIVQKYAARP